MTPDSEFEPLPDPVTEPTSLTPVQRWQRAAIRAALLALVCGTLQAVLPRYTLGSLSLPPLSVVLGVAVAAAMARGRRTVPAAMLGVLLANLLGGMSGLSAALDAGVVGLQAMLAGWLMRHAGDPEILRLDNSWRLRRFVLVTTPATALLGVVCSVLTQWGLDAASAVPLARPQLAAAVGRFIADGCGIVVVAPVLLCWLAQPQAPWRPRRRMLALPMLAFVVVMLAGLDQVAKRDETRLQSRFARDGEARRVRVQQLLRDPLDAALAMRGLVTAGGDNLSQPLFDRLAASWVERVPGVKTLGWIERVPGATAGETELMLRHVFAADAAARQLPGSQVTTEGRLMATPAVWRAVDKALSIDAAVVLPAVGHSAAGQVGAAAASSAASAGLPGAAPNNPDLNDTTLLVLQSVPAASPGAPANRVVVAVVDARRLLAGAMPDDDDVNQRACLTVPGAGGAPARRLAGPLGCETDRVATMLRVQPYKVTLAEHRLDLLVSEPATADNRLFTAVWLLALPAVLGTAMLSALLLALSGRLRRIEDRVRERTAALQAEIDERRQAEAALVESEQRFRAIFESVNIGVTLVSIDGRILQANPAFCEMMSCSLHELMGQPLSDIQLPDVQEDDGTAAAVGGGQARRQRYLTADGRVLQVAAHLRTLYDAAGRPVATVGALQDLTQVLRLREAEREREQAEIASRTKSEFLARLSHELRAPLNAIVGFAQRLSNADVPDTALGSINHRHGLAQIRQAGWHLLDMINDVLDLSRMEAGNLRLTLEPMSLAELAQEAAAMVEPSAMQAGVKVEVSLSPLAENVQADNLRLRQLLINLLGNAIKYNHRGGQVYLRTRPGAVGEVLIEVEDNGMGMSEAQLAELFTPFNRLGREKSPSGSPSSQGTGIGLVICRKLAHLMGGELSVTSREGEGSVFSLRLPRPAGEPVRTQVVSNVPLVSHVTIGSVLYIEDSPSDVLIMQELMKQRPGVTLTCVGTAAEGLARAHDADLILLDLDLPDRSGIEVLRALNADTRMRSVPVIVVSAESRPQRIDECFDAGAAQFLTKPLDAKQALHAIDQGLNPDGPL